MPQNHACPQSRLRQKTKAFCRGYKDSARHDRPKRDQQKGVGRFYIDRFFQAHKTDAIIAKLRELFPHARIMLTLGKDGAVYVDAQQKVFQPIFKVKAVDTTAAGDTFTGYFLA
ncbi:MAG: hypothetical protein II359_05105, partial [Clostridia bacterium]|nr:hypothetical protein [Clostridia bacterium]